MEFALVEALPASSSVVCETIGSTLESSVDDSSGTVEVTVSATVSTVAGGGASEEWMVFSIITVNIAIKDEIDVNER